jgi:hypothetical protein
LIKAVKLGVVAIIVSPLFNLGMLFAEVHNDESFETVRC